MYNMWTTRLRPFLIKCIWSTSSAPQFEIKNPQICCVICCFLTFVFVAFLGKMLQVWNLYHINTCVKVKRDDWHSPISRALKFMWDLSMTMSGSLALPTNRKGTLMFCSGMMNLQKDSTTSRPVALNSNDTCCEISTCSFFFKTHLNYMYFPYTDVCLTSINHVQKCTLLVLLHVMKITNSNEVEKGKRWPGKKQWYKITPQFSFSLECLSVNLLYEPADLQ